jgi:hypothetical protein
VKKKKIFLVHNMYIQTDCKSFGSFLFGLGRFQFSDQMSRSVLCCVELFGQLGKTMMLEISRRCVDAQCADRRLKGLILEDQNSTFLFACFNE